MRHNGFTLIELLVTMLLLAILAAAAAPAMNSAFTRNRMLADQYYLSSALRKARSEAITRKSDIRICASADLTGCNGSSWNDGWIVWEDTDGNGVFEPANDELIHQHDEWEGDTDIKLRGGVDSNLGFQGNGMLADAADTGDILLCHSDGSETFKKGIRIRLSGSVVLMKTQRLVDESINCAQQEEEES